MKRYLRWHQLLLLALLALSMQSCLGIGDNSGFKQTTTGSNNHQVGVNQNQNVFKGKLYFTIDHNLWVLNGATNDLHQLTSGREVRDPAISPDGQRVAFTVFYKNYSDLVYMVSKGGPWHLLKTGVGKFYFIPGLDTPKNTFAWYGQPSWAPDNTHVLFLSDFEKEDWYAYTHYDAPVLDMQVFSLSINHAGATPQDVAYAYVGDGGNSDPSYRPQHPNQIIYTHYAYDNTRTQQVIQLFMEDATKIATHPHGTYWPGQPGYDPGIAITPDKDECLQPAFSPNGNSIAYIKRESDGQMGLHIMPTPENITNNPNNPAVEKSALQPYKQSTLIWKQQFVSQPVWSPDGKQIAFLTYNNQEFDIWLASLNIDPKTGAYSLKDSPIQLTSGGIDGNSRPSWTA